MTVCTMCLEKIPKVKGHRASAEPEFGICNECQKKRQQIITKYGMDQSAILNATIRSLVECSGEAFEITTEQLRLKHKVWAVNAELEDTFLGMRQRSGQARLYDFAGPEKVPKIKE